MHGDDDVAYFSSVCRLFSSSIKGEVDVVIITIHISFLSTSNIFRRLFQTTITGLTKTNMVIKIHVVYCGA